MRIDPLAEMWRSERTYETKHRTRGLFQLVGVLLKFRGQIYCVVGFVESVAGRVSEKGPKLFVELVADVRIGICLRIEGRAGTCTVIEREETARLPKILDENILLDVTERMPLASCDHDTRCAKATDLVDGLRTRIRSEHIQDVGVMRVDPEGEELQPRAEILRTYQRDLIQIIRKVRVYP